MIKQIVRLLTCAASMPLYDAPSVSETPLAWQQTTTDIKSPWGLSEKVDAADSAGAHGGDDAGGGDDDGDGDGSGGSSGSSGLVSSGGSGSSNYPAGGYNYDYDASNNLPPPPYVPHKKHGHRNESNIPPPPQNPGTYGDWGVYRNNWNGQYYPYMSYGYERVIPVEIDFAPYFLVGPYGFYGPYGFPSEDTGIVQNATISCIYINGTRHSNDTWTNGVLINSTYNDGNYTVYATEGIYRGGNSRDIVADGTLKSITYNGTNFTPSSDPKITIINPNVTANGSVLHVKSHSGKKNKAPTAVKCKWTALIFTSLALLL